MAQGCAGSRFLNGTLDLHIQLENALAEYVGKEGALVFSTGFQVNLGVISSIPGRHDYIILMTSITPASLMERVCLLHVLLKYEHNNMQDLERILSKKTDPDKIKLIAIDGVFSMEGDIAKLPEIVALAEKVQCQYYGR